jgi:hypothetical protein
VIAVPATRSRADSLGVAARPRRPPSSGTCCNAVQDVATQHAALKRSTTHGSTTRCNAVSHAGLSGGRTLFFKSNMLQHSAPRCNAPRRTSVLCGRAPSLAHRDSGSAAIRRCRNARGCTASRRPRRRQLAALWPTSPVCTRTRAAPHAAPRCAHVVCCTEQVAVSRAVEPAVQCDHVAEAARLRRTCPAAGGGDCQDYRAAVLLANFDSESGLACSIRVPQRPNPPRQSAVAQFDGRGRS